jgi:5-methylcytosine-specific restriction endonuclease McrA
VTYDGEYRKSRYGEMIERAVHHLGGCCAHCGSDVELEFDHIDPQTKSFEITSRTCLSWERIAEELAKCQLLCSICHKVKSDTEGQVPHGGGAAGRRRCKCDLCRAKKREYMREYMRGRRALANA